MSNMDDSRLTEVITDKEQIFNGFILDVQKWNVTLPDGKPAFREIVLHRGASAIVPVDDEGNVYLVRQYRTPIQKIQSEIPAGKLDYIGEDRFEAAQRELREETGFTAKSWLHLTDMATTPGFCSEVISIYLARGLSMGDTDFDDDEFIDLEKLPLFKAVEMVKSGALSDSKTICGLLLADSAIKEGK